MILNYENLSFRFQFQFTRNSKLKLYLKQLAGIILLQLI